MDSDCRNFKFKFQLLFSFGGTSSSVCVDCIDLQGFRVVYELADFFVDEVIQKAVQNCRWKRSCRRRRGH